MNRARRLLVVAATVGLSAFAATGETPPPLRFVTSKSFIKTTAQECQIRGGEYSSIAGMLPSEMIDCLLPGSVMHLGDGVPTTRPRILGSVYDYLYRASIEKAHYGLYSYLLLSAPGPRSEQLLREVFRTTSYVDLADVTTEQLNIVYLPVRAATIPQLLPIVSNGAAPDPAEFAMRFYDYALARSLLSRLCQTPTDSTARLCQSDPSLGPYIVTYAQPASAAHPLPRPCLLVNLSGVPSEAFGEFVAAYKEQTQRPDFAAGERVNTLRLRLLNILIASADLLKPLFGDPSRTISVQD